MHIQQSPWKIGGRKNRQSLILMGFVRSYFFSKSHRINYAGKIMRRNTSIHVKNRFFIASVEIVSKKVEIMMKNAVKLKNQIFT